MGRRFRKVVDDGSSVTTNTFLYDGWNLISEVSDDGSSVTTNHYVWGLDLSGAMQGAGGIGGLLATVQDGDVYFSCFDANGNLTDYVDANGSNVAHYVYGPFGQTISSSGDKVDDFRFRFSTKYFDQETGMGYYGYRFYSPELGRWLSRDPVGERGGQNLYAFVSNRPLNRVDLLGQVDLCQKLFSYTDTRTVGGPTGCSDWFRAVDAPPDWVFPPPWNIIIIIVQDVYCQVCTYEEADFLNTVYFCPCPQLGYTDSQQVGPKRPVQRTKCRIGPPPPVA